jgi:hypothetical protein
MKRDSIPRTCGTYPDAASAHIVADIRLIASHFLVKHCDVERRQKNSWPQILACFLGPVELYAHPN